MISAVHIFERASLSGAIFRVKVLGGAGILPGFRTGWKPVPPLIDF
jgi:hypothetical protein